MKELNHKSLFHIGLARSYIVLFFLLFLFSLKDYIEKSDKIKESEVWDFFVDLALVSTNKIIIMSSSLNRKTYLGSDLTVAVVFQGLRHIHDNGMVHMDIKPANAFIGLDGLCKIGDFGLVLELSKVC